MEGEKVRKGYFGNLLRFSMPLWAYFLIQTLFGIFDIFFVGRFSSTSDIVAVAVGSQLIYVPVVFMAGYASGIIRTVNSALEKGDRDEAGKALSSGVLVFLICSILLGLFFYLIRGAVVSIMAVPQKAGAATMEYMKVSTLSLPSVTLFILAIAFYRASSGEGRILIHIGFAAAVNAVLDYVFVARMRMGAAGAALATVCAQITCALTTVTAMTLRKKWVKFRFTSMRIDRKIIRTIFRSGSTEAMQNVVIRIAMLFVTAIINRRGLEDAAAAGIGEKFITLLLTFALAMRNGTVRICTGYLRGEKRDVRASRTLLEISLVVTVLYGIAVLLPVKRYAGNLVSLFTADANVIESGTEYLSGYIWEVLFAGIYYIYTGYLVSSNMASLATLNNVATIVMIRIPFVYIVSLVYTHSLYEVGLASTAGSLFSALIGTFIYFYLTRHKKKLIADKS